MRGPSRTLLVRCAAASIIAFYAAEVWLLVTQPGGLPSPSSIALNRRQPLPAGFDVRTPIKVVSDLRAKGVDASPYPFRSFLSGATAAGHPRPLAGRSNAVTVFCNEEGKYQLYRSDRYGFNNPDFVWAQPVDIVVVGDSYVHGSCVHPTQTLVGQLRKTGHRVINLGISESGPLSELAILREYAAPKAPRYVFWCFYEGNDLLDLAQEMREHALTKYLAPLYSQHLMSRQPAIDRKVDSLTASIIESVLNADRRRPAKYIRHVLRLTTLRYSLRIATAPGRPVAQATDSEFEHVLIMARDHVRSWGGELIVVYLPAYYRYAQGDEKQSYQYDEIVNIVKRAGLSMVDGAQVFSSLPNPKTLWRGPRSHYTPRGYQLLAENIAQHINEIR